jgi:hypothetical protein
MSMDYPPEGGIGAGAAEPQRGSGNPEVWAAFFAVWVLFYAITCYLLDVFAVFVLFTAGFAGILALVQCGLAFKRTRTGRSAIGLLAVVAIWYVLIFAPLTELGLAVRFHVEASRYAEAVQELQAGRKPQCVTTQECTLDAEHPERIAFSWGGVTGGWSGIVYDPTGGILDIERNRKAFGGGLTACRAVRQDYYLCTFT